MSYLWGFYILAVFLQQQNVLYVFNQNVVMHYEIVKYIIKF
jgi:hypothetical protein